MYVWADGSGQPGTVIRKDSAMKPIYLDHGYNKIPRYFFTSPMILSPALIISACNKSLTNLCTLALIEM
jgi:hypothetical protein